MPLWIDIKTHKQQNNSDKAIEYALETSKLKTFR